MCDAVVTTVVVLCTDMATCNQLQPPATDDDAASAVPYIVNLRHPPAVHCAGVGIPVYTVM